MATLALHHRFVEDLAGLPRQVQRKLSDFMTRFQKDPSDPGLGFHPVAEGMLDRKVCGAELPNGYRAIIIAPEKGDTYLLMHVAKHDEAYDWARNKRFEVHPQTGVFQVFDMTEVEAAVEERQQAGWQAPPLFERFSDEDLFHAGVPQTLIPSVRALQSDHDLDTLSLYLPPDCRDVLIGLAAGYSLDEALEQMLGVSADDRDEPAPESGGDFRRIGRSASFDLVLVEGEEHLRDILQASLQAWRVFLHPCQRRLVEWETHGPMNINGSAGTGKTVALMHRAAHLARKLTEPDARMLVTTFTTTLSIATKQNLSLLAPDVADRIEVTHLHALARTICRRAGWEGRIAEDEDLDAVWEEVWAGSAAADPPLAREELRAEYEAIIDPHGIDDEESYLTTVRSGRPRLTRSQRRQVWPAMLAFQRGLKQRRLLTPEGAVHQARLAVEQGEFPHYRHVLVDEVQDFSLEALRLIRAISPIEQGERDPLCTVGDGHQRIYQSRVPMSWAGIDIRGRSRRLKVNYRTTEQIRRFAQGILRGVEVDDLDGGVVSTAGDHSVMQGTEPILERCSDARHEADVVVAWVRELLAQGLKSHEICVTPERPDVVSALAAVSIEVYHLKPREEDPGEGIPGVRMGSMKRIKGLEFRAVALACADPDDPMNDLRKADLASCCERYVAATRAREYLLVTEAGSARRKQGGPPSV